LRPKPRLIERDGASAASGATNGGGAAAAAFKLGLQRQPAGRRRALGTGEDRAEVGVGQSDAQLRREAGGAV
jgi:hypothetical protein